MNEMSKEELNKKYKNYLTVGKLKKFLEEHELPDNAKVVIERVEDTYYEDHDWKVYLKQGDHTTYDESGNIDKSTMVQYHPAWCCVKYQGEDDILFIDLHY